MSVFLFKQTETAGVDCACGARTLGRGTGGAPRARAHRRLHRAGLGGAEGGARPGLRGPAGRLAPRRSRQGAAAGTALALAGGEQPRRAPSCCGGRGGPRRLWAGPGCCPSSASSRLPWSGQERKDAYCYFGDRALGFCFRFLVDF